MIVKIFDLFKEIIKAVTYLGIAVLCYLSISVLAGKKTEAAFLLGYFGESNHSLPWIGMVISVVYALFERRLRKRKTEYLQSRNTELEKLIDPQRSTSGLLSTGESNPEDRI